MTAFLQRMVWYYSSPPSYKTSPSAVKKWPYMSGGLS